MGGTISINKINFRDMQYAINNNLLIVNTLENNNQECLIKNTLSTEREIELLNYYINNNKSIKIVIYGENSCDNKIVNKYNQLFELGLKNIYVYIGGLFEWLMLQDIFGEDEFPTTTKITNILKFQGDTVKSLKI